MPSMFPKFATLASLISLICLSACSGTPPAGNPQPPAASPSPGSASPAPLSSPSASPAPLSSPSASPAPSGGLTLTRSTTLAGARVSVPKALDGSLAEARFQEPSGVVSDGKGTVYVADSGSHSIRKITASGVTTLAGTGSPGYQDGPGAAARFRYPTDLALDPQGNLYVCDSDNHRIRKVAPDGTVSTLAGSGKNAYADGAALEAAFYNPHGLDRGPDGTLYVADKTNNMIRKITPAGQVSTLAGMPDGSGGMNDAKGTAASFRQPMDVAMTPRGLYVADFGNHAIRLIAADGGVSTVAGAGQRFQGYEDGLGAAARLNGPGGISACPDGTLYFTEFNGSGLRQLSPAGLVTTLISGLNSGDAAGPLASAKVRSPLGVHCDGQAVYVADRDNQIVRKLE